MPLGQSSYLSPLVAAIVTCMIATPSLAVNCDAIEKREDALRNQARDLEQPDPHITFDARQRMRRSAAWCSFTKRQAGLYQQAWTFHTQYPSCFGHSTVLKDIVDRHRGEYREFCR